MTVRSFLVGHAVPAGDEYGVLLGGVDPNGNFAPLTLDLLGNINTSTITGSSSFNLIQVGGTAVQAGRSAPGASLPVVLDSGETVAAAGATAPATTAFFGVYNTTPLALTNGQAAAFQADVRGYPLINLGTALDSANDQVALGAALLNGYSLHHRLTTGSDNVSVVAASAPKGRQVAGWHLANNNTGYAIRLKFYDKATAPNPASDPVSFAITIPAAASSILPTVVQQAPGPIGGQFVNGLAYAVVKGEGDTDATAVSASDLDVNLWYK